MIWASAQKKIMWSHRILVSISVTFKLLMISLGRLQDIFSNVKYTDVDYHVFVDASRFVYNGTSPYGRPTYRYSPIIAWLLTPSVFYFEFGKVVFCLFDTLNCLLIYQIIKNSRNSEKIFLFCLFDPFSTIISSRGNAESLVQFTVLLTLYFLERGRPTPAALAHGLAVHLKLYPVVYLPVVFLSFLPQKFTFKDFATNFKGAFYIFGALSIACLSNCLCYWMYGEQFLNEALLYHLYRSDIKHNFSVYFYPLYLTYEKFPAIHSVLSKCAFLPQIICILIFACRYKKDLAYCWFVTTFAFVSFNKVCTSQYFVWYLSLFPLILHKLDLSLVKICKFLAFWFSGQVVWLIFAYFLEFRGSNVFVFVWLSSLLFLCVNVFLIVKFNSSYARKMHVKKSA